MPGERLGNMSGNRYPARMTTIKSIPAEWLRGLDVHEGDTLHILALKETAVLVQISRVDLVQKAASGKVGEWARSARGSVRLAANETADDVRMDYYAAKHGLNP